MEPLGDNCGTFWDYWGTIGGPWGVPLWDQWDHWSTIGVLLGYEWGTTGGPLGDHWGTIRDNWGTSGDEFD